MNKSELAEALYALPNGVVVKGRKSLLLPMVLTAVGAAALIANGVLPAVGENADLKSALILLGGVIFVVGLCLLLMRLFGRSGVPCLATTHRPLVWEEYFYTKERAATVVDAIARHDWSKLRTLEQCSVPAVQVVCYHTPDDGFVACQAFEYVELEERPLTQLQVVQRPGV